MKAVVTAYKKSEGVTEAKVDYGKSTVAVTYDPKKITEETLVTEVLKGTKYSASRMDESDKHRAREQN